MKILYIVRLYSGLERSIADRVWEPTGVPAIYKVIEALDRNGSDLRIVFTCKDFEAIWHERVDETFSVRGLRAAVTVLAGAGSPRSPLKFLRGVFREVRQVFRIISIYKEFRPNLVYFDRINFLPAAFFARFTKVPIVLRLMGVGTKFLKDVLTSRHPSHSVIRLAYRSPFSAVICTQDGSGVEPWLKKMLSPSVPFFLMINGVDVTGAGSPIDPRLKALPEGRTMVLFVGRLERLKGCEEFVKGFLLALEKEPKGLHALIVGSGSLAQSLQDMVAEQLATDRVTFIEELAHDQVGFALGKAHIYVSLNRGGNLSNSNLEAMKAGVCIIMPASQPQNEIDVTTDRLIPEKAVYRIPATEDVNGLAEAILFFHRNPEERRARAERIASVAEKIIPNWENRINAELDILERLGKKRENQPTSKRQVRRV